MIRRIFIKKVLTVITYVVISFPADTEKEVCKLPIGHWNSVTRLLLLNHIIGRTREDMRNLHSLILGVYGLNVVSLYYSIRGIFYYHEVASMKKPCLDSKDLRMMMVVIWTNMLVCLPLIIFLILLMIILVSLPLLFIAWSIYG